MRQLSLISDSVIIFPVYFFVHVMKSINRLAVYLKLFFQTALSIMIIGVFFPIYAIDGFAIWSKGSGCELTLHYTDLTGMKSGETKVAVRKGTGADIWPVISYDGKWIAWCRCEETFNGRWGKCDYHKYDFWYIYIAKIDGGKTLPANPIKVANGYLPQWGDDAKGPDKNKTLYFTKYSDQTIQRVTIKPDGSFTPPEVHATCLKSMSGSKAHTQGSPNGRYIAYRPDSIQIQDNTTKTNIFGAGGKGQHPHWGPRSKYLLWSKRNVCRVDNGKVTMKVKSSGLGTYWFGVSNDAYWGKNKIWVIGRCKVGRKEDGDSPVGQMEAGDVCFREVDISNKGYKVGSSTTIGKGTAADIHVFAPINPARKLPGINRVIGNRIDFTTRFTKSFSGLQLIIISEDLSSGYYAALYDLQGKQKAFLKMSAGSLKNVLPLKSIADGRYVLKLNNNKMSVQKSVLIFR